MNWKDIEVSSDNTFFLFEGNPIFDKVFFNVLKFHSPGIAPVKDETGSYHINYKGSPLYIERYSRTFGFYCNRAAAVLEESWFHLTEKGLRAYSDIFEWTGNFQENLCTVRDFEKNYFHIGYNGSRIYSDSYLYCGDFKDNIACVKQQNGLYKHIDSKGNFINNKEFIDLGVFHKGFATAKDNNGWFHIEKNGNEIYKHRFLEVEPYYNGFSLVTQFNNKKIIIDELGRIVLDFNY